MKCKLCIGRGRPDNFGSEPRCAFESGVFSAENWNCATATQLRAFANEGRFGEDTAPPDERFWVRRDDQSYAALYIPPHPDDVPEGKNLGEWRGGGFIAMTWYKYRGQTQVIVRVDGWDDKRKGEDRRCALPLTLKEAEAAIENLRIRKNAQASTVLPNE